MRITLYNKRNNYKLEKMKVGIKRPEQTSGIDFTKREPKKTKAMKKKTNEMTFVPLIIGFKLNLYSI